MLPAPGHEIGYEVELPSAKFKHFVGVVAPILSATCTVLKVAAAVARPVAKMAGVELPASEGLNLACLRDVKCGESTLGEVFEGTAVGEVMTRLEAAVGSPVVAASQNGGPDQAEAAAGHSHNALDDAESHSVQRGMGATAGEAADPATTEIQWLDFLDDTLNQCEGIVELVESEAWADLDEVAESEHGFDAANSASASSAAAVQPVDAVKDLIAIGCKQAHPPRESDVGKHVIAGLAKTVVQDGGIRWLCEAARDTEAAASHSSGHWSRRSMSANATASRSIALSCASITTCKQVSESSPYARSVL